MTLTVDWLAPEAEGASSIAAITGFLRRAQATLATIPIASLAVALDDLSEVLLTRGNRLIAAYPASGLPFLARFCRSDQLLPLIDDSLGDASCLDRFVSRPALPQSERRAFARGLVVHWLAGNVPTLGALSLVSAMMTKNASIVRMPSAAEAMLSDLLAAFHAMGESHRALASAVAVLRYDRDDRATAEALSREADVRIAWGGDESTAAVRALPSRSGVADLFFTDRSSLAIVGRGHASGDRAATTARLLAHDISVFEQKACASPHTVFVACDDDDARDAFAAVLAEAMGSALRQIPKRPPSPQESQAILNLRGQYAMFHRAWHPNGLDYSVLADDRTETGPAIGNRTVFVRRLPPLETLAAALPANVQSVGLAADGDEREAITDFLGRAGVLRFPALGAMTHFELPWDGLAIPQYLVRWATRPAARSANP